MEFEEETVADRLLGIVFTSLFGGTVCRARRGRPTLRVFER